MAEQMRPTSKETAPDPSYNYERSHPEREAGMGRLDNNVSTPTDAPDQEEAAVKNKQEPQRQVNAQDVEDERRQRDLTAGPGRTGEPDHSMKEEEPLGWDQAPTGIQDPQQKRQPRTEGKGGVE